VFGRRIMTNPQTEIPLQIAAQVLPSFNCDCEAGVNSRRQFSSVVKMLRFVEATADSSPILNGDSNCNPSRDWVRAFSDTLAAVNFRRPRQPLGKIARFLGRTTQQTRHLLFKLVGWRGTS
jgi:hypothetical protein